MPPSSAGRRGAAAATAAVLAMPLLTTLTPSATAVNPVADPVVRLAADPGSPVRAAETALAPGVTRLRTSTYSQVAVTWAGAPPPRVSIRTAPDEPWRTLPPLADGPDLGSVEGTPGRSGTDLLWTGPRTGLDVRVRGTGFTDLELVLVDPGSLPSDGRPVPDVSARRRPAAAEQESAPQPFLFTRKDWGADNSWRNGEPVYLKQLKQVHVHHTATGNRYSRADVPGIVRGMYRYHTKTLGWFDLGYNFVVDRFGRAWVGRSGGPRRLVRGAHTLGFNRASVGIAMIGNLDERKPGGEAVRKILRLAAWKLDARGSDATGRVRVRSTGSDKYADGKRVRLPVIDGHRDTNDTACPGQKLYDRLPGIRRRAQARIDAYPAAE